MIDPRAARDEALESELEPGEKLLWSGAPDARRMALQTLPILIFAIPWTAGSIAWIVIAMTATGAKAPPVGLAFFGLPFVALGLLMLAAPYFAYRTAARTVYAVTDKRLLIVILGGTRSIASYRAADLSRLERVERADGKGDVIFAERLRLGPKGRRRTQKIGFLGIDDPHGVERLITTHFMKT